MKSYHLGPVQITSTDFNIHSWLANFLTPTDSLAPNPLKKVSPIPSEHRCFSSPGNICVHIISLPFLEEGGYLLLPKGVS